MNFVSPIIPSEDMERLLAAETRLAEAETALTEAQAAAAEIRAAATREGFADGLAEGAEAAAAILSGAQQGAREQALGLEQTLSGLVAGVVRKIIGSYDQQDVTIAAVRTAIERLAGHERAKLHVSADMRELVEAAVAKADENSADLEVVLDESLPAGECVFSAQTVHVRVGLEAQIETALRPYLAGGAAQ